jgi:hypothetical protein
MAPLQNEIARVSLDLSRQRKCKAIMLELDLDYYLDTRVPSSACEIEADWHHACVCFVDAIMTGWTATAGLLSSDLHLLDNVWIDDLKRHLAFCYWLGSHSDDSSEAFRELQYFRACQALDGRLADPHCKATPAVRQVLLRYLMDTYPQNGNGLAVDGLIANKKERLPADAQHLAAEFVKMFYPNIIAAVSTQYNGPKRADATLAVLKALRLGGGSHPAKPEIVSGLEALLAVALLDADEVTRARGRDASTKMTF